MSAPGQLSGLDAAFLSLETSNAPMHIGGVSLIDPHTPRGHLDFDIFRRFLAARLGAVPSLHRRLAEVPLNLGRPYWVEDEAVDLDAHLEHVRLPAPGGWEQLTALAARELGRPLPRQRPLWKVTFVEGVDAVEGVPAGGVALLTKVHHAAVDGVSGAAILGALFDAEPLGGGAAATGSADGIPDDGSRGHTALDGRATGHTALEGWELLKRTGSQLLRAPLALPDAIGRSVRAVAGAGATWALHRVHPPPLPWTAPPAPWNRPITAERVWDGALLPLARIKALKNLLETTLNDVVLAVCAGALRHLLLERGELPESPLVAMVPVSIRDGDPGDPAATPGSGNQVSAMLVSLATDEAHPVRRLRRIHEGAQASKLYLRAVGARTLTDSSRFIPFALAGLAARLYTGLHLAERHRPAFNLVITNVPGPRETLSVGGARLLAHFGAAPIFDGMGLILPVFSYAGMLTIGVTSCPALLPDARRITSLLHESLEELEAAVR